MRWMHGDRNKTIELYRCNRKEKTLGRSKAKKPTRDQKEYIANAGLVVKNWLVLRETEEEIHLVSRGTGMNRRIKKDRR